MNKTSNIRQYMKRYFAERRANGQCGKCSDEAIKIIYLHHNRQLAERFTWRCPKHTKRKLPKEGQ